MHKAILFLAPLLLLPYHIEALHTKGHPMPTRTEPNHLAGATSPYLLAHAHNPVDWYPWSDEAFARATAEKKPIFLSIGYNACHWCHVMERESFENQEIADTLNKYFISIKVDREERPDIDQIYMSAVQAVTGSGGWPMTIFMTPDKHPFFAGTYFPPQSNYGRPGFLDVIMQIAKIYRETPDEIQKSAKSILDHISTDRTVDLSGRAIDRNVIVAAADTFAAQFDGRYGGFGTAPKFPQPMALSLLFRATQLTGNRKYAEMALYTLTQMSGGGLYDQLGGGFHRYSTDQSWLVPHFEKMLYDNALLVMPLLEAYQVSGDQSYLTTARGVLEYIQKRMTDPEGGFYSTEDADTDGEEGQYYVWDKSEIDRILGPEAGWFDDYFGVSADGNFEGKNILNVSSHADSISSRTGLRDEDFAVRLRQLKAKLLAERENRSAPAIDDKILASWNGLAISAFAHAYLVTGDTGFLQSARNAADFVLRHMTAGDFLYHSYRKGSLLKTELLEDYAYFSAGLIDLYQATFDESYLERARSLVRRAVDQFAGDSLFYLSPAGSPDLIFRPRDLLDGATPSPGSVMIFNLLRLAAITDDKYFATEAKRFLDGASGLAVRVPQGSATLILAGYFNLTGPVEIVISGKDSQKMTDFNRKIFSKFIPNKIVVGNINGSKSALPLLEGRQDSGELTYFFCKDNTCRLPVTDLTTLDSELAWAAESHK
jgi:uncharacterized protein